MIEAKNMNLIYPNGTVGLNEINLKVEAGDMVYIIGPSGSGKTSLLKLLMGMEYPTGGSLEVLGQPIAKAYAGKIRRLRMSIGPVFQEFKLIKGRTSMENVMLGMRFTGIAPGLLKENAENALDRVGLGHKKLSLVENLSWGECQRVAIARAVARKPALIIADEPTGNLDKDNAMNILELLNGFRDKNTAVIVTTHATHLIESTKGVKLIRMDKGCMSMERLG